MDELIAAAAAAMNAPEDLVVTSARARAEADGVPVEDVLRSWAGDAAPAAATADAEPVPAPATEPAASAAEPAPEPPAAAEVPAATPAVAAPPADTASLVAAAAAATGMSESMVERSAGARAKAQGVTVEAVLAEWAGQGAPEATPAAPVAAPAPAAPAEAAAPAELEVEVIGEAPPAKEPEEPEEVDELEEAAAVGALPRWLVALFIVIPSFAVAYALFLPNGPACGDAGRLAVDPVSGELVNCDGSAIGESEIDFFTIGLEQYSATGCVGCHGPDGAGLGNFPAFTGGAVLETFPEGSCADHVEWVRLGTAGWPDDTYGAQPKSVGGSGAVMPPFASLSDEQLRSVVLYERVQFGGQELEAALSDCGLTAAPAASE